MWNKIKEAWVNAFEAIKEPWKKCFDAFKDAVIAFVIAFLGFLVGLFTLIFETLSAFVKSVFVIISETVIAWIKRW